MKPPQRSITRKTRRVPNTAGRLVGKLDGTWFKLVPETHWLIYKAAIRAVRAQEIQFALGGAFALAGYTGRWRNTKDLDLYLQPKDREPAIQALHSAGFSDYYTQLPYDRAWIYRGIREGVIVDVIWSMANQRAQVDLDWFDHARPLRLANETLEALPPEELAWCKLYVLQRDRCDWPDLLNLLHAAGAEMDWRRLLARSGEDAPLVHALLNVFQWLCPDRARKLPQDLNPPSSGSGFAKSSKNFDRVRLLDSRPWFAADQPKDAPLQL
jgi:hypothetical protein